jgi:peptidoglycan-associated lipoprotein
MRALRTAVSAVLLTATTSVAAADPPPDTPDFHTPHAVRGDLDRSMAASQADGPMQPVDVIHFGFDSVTLDGADRAQLAAVVPWMARHPGARLVVEGHADATGPAAYNEDLSRRRAEAVRDELIAAGVPGDRIEVAVFGEEHPVSSRDWLNRRVRIWGSFAPADPRAGRTP